MDAGELERTQYLLERMLDLAERSADAACTNKRRSVLQKGFEENRIANAKILLEGLRFVNKNGQPLRFMKRLELDPALLEQPLYH